MKYPSEQPYTFDRVIRTLISIIALGLAVYLFYILRDVLLPFLIAWLMAYMLNPVVRFFQKRLHLRHSIAVLATLLSVVGIIILLGVLLTPLIETEIWQINSIISNYQLTSPDGESEVTIRIADTINRYIDFQALRDGLNKDSIIETIQYVSPVLESLLTNTISILIGFTIIFIVILYLIFILIDYDKINELWRSLIPPKYRAVASRITVDVERGMNTYFRHQAFICLILAILYAIGFQLVGIPLAIIFGLIVGFIHMVPYMQVITFPPAILLCWLQAAQTGQSFWGLIGLVALVYVVNQILMDGFLVPKIMGKATGLNPAIILLSLSVWGSLLGFVGMIIAIPLTTLLLAYYKEFISASEKIQATKNAREAENLPPE